MGQDSGPTELGRFLRYAREERGWSTRQLAERSGVYQTTIVRIETGQFTSLTPDRLALLAAALDLPLADLYSLAGYPLPTELPALPAYLRAKYRDLPAPAHEELAAYVAHLTDKYGVTPAGPRPGEDEDEATDERTRETESNERRNI